MTDGWYNAQQKYLSIELLMSFSAAFVFRENKVLSTFFFQIQIQNFSQGYTGLL